MRAGGAETDALNAFFRVDVKKSTERKQHSVKQEYRQNYDTT